MSKKQPLNNAAKIIERFGGIRPMAAKIDTPVTTVQGWKKRDVIPATRRELVLSAASKNNIDLSGLTGAGASNENLSSKKATSVTEKVTKKESVPASTSKSESIPAIETSSYSLKAHQNKRLDNLNEPKKDKTHEHLVSQIEQNNTKAVAMSAWIATGFILLAIMAGLFLLIPKLKTSQETIQKQSQQLVQLEDKVDEVRMENSKKKFLGASLPEDMQEKFDNLQNQAHNISVTVDQLSQKAKEISAGAMNEGSIAISQRLETLEKKIEEISGPDGSFAGLIARIRELENSVAGQVQLENSANQLRSMLNTPNNEGSIDQNLENIQEGEQGALSQTLEGVSRPDLQAAAILIAFSQFRSSLEREAPFEDDLALLQKLVGDDNPELQENLTRLSPYANNGVLTSKGLSTELKKLTGDIVVSSLNGEDISIAEKAKARFGNIVRIEKDGELISGTKTQATVSRAQEYVDEGKIEDSIATLQGLDGEAAVVAQPFIKQAKASLLAEKVKAMLSQNILEQVEGQTDALKNLQMPNVNMNSIYDGVDKIEKSIPLMGGDKIIKDEESGIIILPHNNSFKGLSESQ